MQSCRNIVRTLSLNSKCYILMLWDILNSLSVEVAWRLPSFYTHHFCGIRDGQLSIPVTKRAESRSASTQGLGNAVSPSRNPSEIVGKVQRRACFCVTFLPFPPLSAGPSAAISAHRPPVHGWGLDFALWKCVVVHTSQHSYSIEENRDYNEWNCTITIGNTGVAVMLYEPRYKHSVSRLERESRVKFEHISVPQPTDVAQSAGSEAADAIASVSDSVIPIFRQQAEQLLSSYSLSAADLLAKALAKVVLELTEICVLGLHRHKEKIIVIFLGGLQYTTSSNWQTDVVTWVCYNILVIVFLYRRGHICSHWCYLQFDVGNVVMVTGGRNTGRVGVIKNWEKHKSIFE
ncbi:hypothetical protein ACJX0J_007322, partial [Zea mays]